MALAWNEVVERGQHRFECDHDGVRLEITKTHVPDTWACVLPSGSTAIGPLRIVKSMAESVMIARARGDCRVL
jgi:hypothetical protein